MKLKISSLKFLALCLAIFCRQSDAFSEPAIIVTQPEKLQVSCAEENSGKLDVALSVSGLDPKQAYSFKLEPYYWGPISISSKRLSQPEFLYPGLRPEYYRAQVTRWTGKERIVIAETKFQIETPEPTIHAPDVVLPDTPFTYSVENAVTPSGPFGMYAVIVPQDYPLEQITVADLPFTRKLGVKTCELGTRNVKGLPQGVYEIRLFQSAYREDPLLSTKKVLVSNRPETLGVTVACAGEDVPESKQSELLSAYNYQIDTLKAISDDAEFATLAWATYNNQEALKLAGGLGWTPFKTFGATTDGLTGDVAATLFLSERGQAVLAFRGSISVGDWVTNVAGSLVDTDSNLYSQINGSNEIVDEVIKTHPEVIFVGHSLGGRLATLASLRTGNRAVVFDRAPSARTDKSQSTLSPEEFIRLEAMELSLAGSSELVTAYRAPDDPLTAVFATSQGDRVIQNMLPGDGHDIGLLAKAMQEVRDALDKGWLNYSQINRDSAQCD